jgi:hypothetical protein
MRNANRIKIAKLKELENLSVGGIILKLILNSIWWFEMSSPGAEHGAVL